MVFKLEKNENTVIDMLYSGALRSTIAQVSNITQTSELGVCLSFVNMIAEDLAVSDKQAAMDYLDAVKAYIDSNDEEKFVAAFESVARAIVSAEERRGKAVQ